MRRGRFCTVADWCNLAGTVRLNILEAGRAASWHLWMAKHSPFRYFKICPDIIRLAIMLYDCFPRSLRNVEGLFRMRLIERFFELHFKEDTFT